MNKTAKEMFEDLGYEFIYKNKYEVKYAKEDIFFSKMLNQKCYASSIIINFERNDFHKLGSYITFEELKAVNKQIDELEQKHNIKESEYQ